MAEQMKKIFQGMKIALSVTVDGKILETNAAYRDGSKITLMEVDFGKLMEMPEQLAKFSQSKPNTIEEFKALIQNMPGMKSIFNRLLIGGIILGKPETIIQIFRFNYQLIILRLISIYVSFLRKDLISSGKQMSCILILVICFLMVYKILFTINLSTG